MNLAARSADKIVLLNRGRVAADGTAAEGPTAVRIRDVFGVEATLVPVEPYGCHLIFD